MKQFRTPNLDLRITENAVGIRKLLSPFGMARETRGVLKVRGKSKATYNFWSYGRKVLFKHGIIVPCFKTF